MRLTFRALDFLRFFETFSGENREVNCTCYYEFVSYCYDRVVGNVCHSLKQNMPIHAFEIYSSSRGNKTLESKLGYFCRIKTFSGENRLTDVHKMQKVCFSREASPFDK